MLKTLLLLIVGLGAGFAIAFWLEPDAPAVVGPGPVAAERAVWPPAAAPQAGARLESLENALAEEIERRTELEARVVELATELEALRAAELRSSEASEPAASDSAGGEPPVARFRRDAVALREDAQRRQSELLIAGGFAPDRAEWINRRTQELRMESLQAQYDATREGRPLEPGVALAGERTLRTELGDTDYERYLQALNRPTAVAVRDVLASSPAERTGLRAGDEVVAYDGKRVFDMRELNALTLEGTAGESVVVEVRRDGQALQLVMPRGPIGIMGGGGFRGR
jgi:hypothetical protein